MEIYASTCFASHLVGNHRAFVISLHDRRNSKLLFESSGLICLRNLRELDRTDLQSTGKRARSLSRFLDTDDPEGGGFVKSLGDDDRVSLRVSNVGVGRYAFIHPIYGQYQSRTHIYGTFANSIGRTTDLHLYCRAKKIFVGSFAPSSGWSSSYRVRLIKPNIFRLACALRLFQLGSFKS